VSSRLHPVSRPAERGFALITVLMLTALVAALLGAHFLIARTGLSTTRSAMDAGRGFYAAEAGLNVRAEEIRKTFLGYNRPTGAPPAPLPGQRACDGGDMGSGDYACTTYDISGREVRTWVSEDPANPRMIVIPPGEDFQNLTAQDYVYFVNAVALSDWGRPEAILEMHFTSRLVPLFQFAAFYDKDLEILPGPAMTLAGPVHSNGNLFLSAGTSLEIDGQVTTAAGLYHGRKNDATCAAGPVSVHDLSGPLAMPACAGGVRDQLLQADVDGTNPPHLDWQGQIHVGATTVAVPPPEVLDPGALYWDLADLRIVRDLTDAAAPVKVYQASGAVDVANTANLAALCPTAVGSTAGTLTNHREATTIQMLEVDVQGLMDCIENDVPALMGGRALDDTTQGGLVWYFGVDDGVNAAAPNNYGVRVRGGATLAPSSGAVDVAGLTIITNQALYVQGDFNQDNGAAWRPAAFMADSLNILSNAWNDGDSAGPLNPGRVASTTTIRAAFLAGTDTTGGVEGALDTGNYNGGLENYPRFHEDWNGVTLTYRGSFVSLDTPLRVDGPWSAQSYVPPVRDWGFETRFADASNLPPLTPRFVYLKQELFVRDFEY
jgi:hypothetical protein